MMLIIEHLNRQKNIATKLNITLALAVALENNSYYLLSRSILPQLVGLGHSNKSSYLFPLTTKTPTLIF